MRDIFEPRSEPARSIYLAFQAEATKRKGRTVEEWTSAERDAVFQVSARLAEQFGLRPATLEEVIAGERYARGSIDYGAKWAHQVVHAMRKPNPVQGLT